MIRAIVISSIEPEPTVGGQIKLHRHLVDNPGIQLVVHPAERRLYARKKFRHRLIAKLERTRLKRWVADGEVLQASRWLDDYLPAPPADGIANVVVTIAQRNAGWAAQRYAQKHRIPLVTWFDDWWPDMEIIHSPFNKLLDQRFRELYRQSQLALCVSERMRALLGPHPNAHVLYPIPAKANPLLPSPTPLDRFRVMYFGNLGEYGPMMAEALSGLRQSPTVRMEVCGGNPRWPEPFRQEMEREGLWHNFVPRAELQRLQAMTNAFLVAMVFEPGMRRFMETSFPSKMLEMAQWGKPLVIWGPEYCSAVQWARQGNRALCVTDPNRVVLRRELEKLAASTEEQQRLAAAAREAADTIFNPDKIHAQFMETLRRLVVQ